MSLLSIQNLHVSVEDKEILKGLDLEVRTGEIHALMGPNGSGKSTLASTLMGHPDFSVTEGHIKMNHESRITNHEKELLNILELSPDERAKAGIFLAFQYPVSVPGVSVLNFLRSAFNTVHPDKHMSLPKFKEYITEEAGKIGMDSSFLERPLNEGFSGGEKKKAEILQMSILKPHFAILDETDSGLDVDALKAVSMGVNRLTSPNLGILIITHYQRILDYIKPDFVHVMKEGRIVESGGAELARQLEESGYEQVTSNS